MSTPRTYSAANIYRPLPPPVYPEDSDEYLAQMASRKAMRTPVPHTKPRAPSAPPLGSNASRVTTSHKMYRTPEHGPSKSVVTDDRDRRLLTESNYGSHKALDATFVASISIEYDDKHQGGVSAICAPGDDGYDLPLTGQSIMVPVSVTRNELPSMHVPYTGNGPKLRHIFEGPRRRRARYIIPIMSHSDLDGSREGVSFRRILHSQSMVKGGSKCPSALEGVRCMKVIFHMNGYASRFIMFPVHCPHKPHGRSLNSIAFCVARGYKFWLQKDVDAVAPHLSRTNVPGAMTVTNLRLISLYCVDDERSIWWPEIGLETISK